MSGEIRATPPSGVLRVTAGSDGDRINQFERMAPHWKTEMSAIQSPPIVPIEFAGKWIAWDFDETRIIACGRSYQETKNAALATGENRPILEKVPDARVRFIGGHR